MTPFCVELSVPPYERKIEKIDCYSSSAVRTLAVDIAGAFDKVSHLGVLHKLRSSGCVRTLKTLKST